MRRSSTPRTILRPTSCSGSDPTGVCGGHRHPIRAVAVRLAWPAFKLRAPLTWGQPASKLELRDPALGRVQVLVWHLLHFRQAAAQPLVVVRSARRDAAHTVRATPACSRRRTAPAGDLVGLVSAALGRGSLAALCPAGHALDAAAPGHPRTGRALERCDAAAHLAALAGPDTRQRRALAVAAAPNRRAQATGPGAPGHGGTFGGDWHTGPVAETPQKSARVAGRARA